MRRKNSVSKSSQGPEQVDSTSSRIKYFLLTAVSRERFESHDTCSQRTFLRVKRHAGDHSCLRTVELNFATFLLRETSYFTTDFLFVRFVRNNI
jgi:hypothetical protein